MIARHVHLLLALFSFMAPIPCLASSVVRVIMFDDGVQTPMASGIGIGLGPIDMTKATMHMVAVPQYALEGDVTFEVTNNSVDSFHELLFLKIPTSNRPLPFDVNQNKVDEQKLMPMGMVPALSPRQSGSVTIRLTRGEYILFCNEPGHYMAGMWTILKVR